jgi:hypothetical protein
MQEQPFCCGNCVFYAYHKENHGETGLCTRFPPKIFLFPKPGVIGSELKMIVKHLRPVMAKDDLCGEHVLRPDEKNSN